MIKKENIGIQSYQDIEEKITSLTYGSGKTPDSSKEIDALFIKTN